MSFKFDRVGSAGSEVIPRMDDRQTVSLCEDRSTPTGTAPSEGGGMARSHAIIHGFARAASQQANQQI